MTTIPSSSPSSPPVSTPISLVDQLATAQKLIKDLTRIGATDEAHIQAAIVAMGNGADEARWPSGMHVITALINERDRLQAAINELLAKAPCTCPEHETVVGMMQEHDDTDITCYVNRAKAVIRKVTE